MHAPVAGDTEVRTLTEAVDPDKRKQMEIAELVRELRLRLDMQRADDSPMVRLPRTLVSALLRRLSV